MFSFLTLDAAAVHAGAATPTRAHRPSAGSRRRVWSAAPPPDSIACIASRLFADITPLRRSRDYRLLFSGQAAAYLGRQLTVVAAPLQVYALTESSLAVGLLGLAQFPFLLLGSLFGGTLADGYDRKRLLLIANLAPLVCSLALALNARRDGGGALWPIFLFTALQAGLSGLDSPTRNAVTPELVGEDLITAAAALNQILFQVGGVTGPALAGLLIGAFDVSVAYWLEVVAFAVALGLLVRLRPLPPLPGAARAGVSSLMEGFAFLRGRRALQGTFIVDINAMVFGMPRALFPELAATVFGGGPRTAGLLFAAPGAGALLGAVASGWTTRVRRQGRAVLWAVVAWGVAIAGFAATSLLPLALFLLAVAGAADVVSAVFRNTILQRSVPPRLRGRLNAVHISVVAGGPRLGDVESGVVAAAAGPQVSAISGGLACVLGVGLIARFLPELGRWTPDQAYVESAPTDDAAGDGPPRSDASDPDGR